MKKFLKSETDKCLERFDKLRNSSGSNSTAELRLSMQKTLCNQNVQYLEQKKHLKEGIDEIRKPYEGMDRFIC